MADKNRSKLQKLTHKYRFVIINPENFEEKSSFSLSRLNVLMVVSFVFSLSFLVMFFLLAFTPIKLYIPGYRDMDVDKRLVRQLTWRADSMEMLLKINERYVNNIRGILSDSLDLSDQKEPEVQPLESDVEDIDLSYVSPTDSALRKEMEKETYSLSFQKSKAGISEYYFYAPVKGIVSQEYKPSQQHFAIDIVTEPDEGIRATLDGIVLFSEYSAETGNVMIIQHSNDLVSVYKHSSVNLKNVGSFVKAGEVIGIVGNTGRHSSGPHLHFELWQGGKPLNPQEYIVF